MSIKANNKNKVIAYQFLGQNFFSSVIARVASHHKYSIIYIDREVNLKNNKIDTGVSIDNFFNIESINKSFIGIDPVFLDRKTLSDFSECYGYFLRTVDRVFIEPKSQRFLQQYFHELLRYWIAYFRKNSQVSKLIMSDGPHFPWEIVMYFCAQNEGIKVLFPSRTSLTSFVVMQSHVCGYGPSKSTGNKVKFTTEPIDALGKESVWVDEAKAINNNSIMHTASLWKKIKRFILMSLWLMKNHNRYKGSATPLTSLKHIYYFFSQMRKDSRLAKVWNSLSSEVDLNAKYIYFAMPYQPERTTDPQAHEISNPYIALAILSRALPNGWKIYVKEHPRQLGKFHPDIRNRHYRSIPLYHKIFNLPNIQLVPIGTDSDLLIQKCSLTACLTGSTVWEGMLIGKAGFLFGDNWHAACKSGPSLRTLAEVREEITELSEKSTEEVGSDVADFLLELRDDLIESEISDTGVKASLVDKDHLVNNMAEAYIVRF